MAERQADRPWRMAGGALLLELKVVPNSRADRVDGLAPDVDGGCRLVLRIKAPPVDGKANAAVIALLAKALGCPKSALDVTSGTTARQKRIAWRHPPEDALERLEMLLARARQGA